MNAELTWHDPIVEEIHQVRRELAERYHHDLDAIAKALDDQARALGFTTKRPPSPIDAVETKAS